MGEAATDLAIRKHQEQVKAPQGQVGDKGLLSCLGDPKVTFHLGACLLQASRRNIIPLGLFEEHQPNSEASLLEE